MFDLGTYLLLSAKVAGKIFMNGQIGHLFYQPSGRTCRKERVLSEQAPVSDTLVLHQFFLGFVCYKSDIHQNSPSKYSPDGDNSFTFNTKPIPMNKLTRLVSP